MSILDDVCASQHGQKAGADQNLKGKLADNQRQNKYFEDWGMGKLTRLLIAYDNISFSQFFSIRILLFLGFAIHHYAGIVRYNVEGKAFKFNTCEL